MIKYRVSTTNVLNCVEIFSGGKRPLPWTGHTFFNRSNFQYGRNRIGCVWQSLYISHKTNLHALQVSTGTVSTVGILNAVTLGAISSHYVLTVVRGIGALHQPVQYLKIFSERDDL